MMDRTGAERSVALANRAIELTGDERDACFVLIAAALACHEIAREELPPAKAEDLSNLLSVAASLMADERCGGLLDLVGPAGHA